MEAAIDEIKMIKEQKVQQTLTKLKNSVTLFEMKRRIGQKTKWDNKLG